MSQVGGGLPRLLAECLHARVRQTEGIDHHLPCMVKRRCVYTWSLRQVPIGTRVGVRFLRGDWGEGGDEPPHGHWCIPVHVVASSKIKLAVETGNKALSINKYKVHVIAFQNLITIHKKGACKYSATTCGFQTH